MALKRYPKKQYRKFRFVIRRLADGYALIDTCAGVCGAKTREKIVTTNKDRAYLLSFRDTLNSGEVKVTY